MKTRINSKQIVIVPLRLIALLFSIVLFFSSCTEENTLQIQNNFPFEIEIMPIPKSITTTEKVEIRINIKRKNQYINTFYLIRYFQFDGHGTLQYYDAPPYYPNDIYELPLQQFRLYYTSKTTIPQSFDIWISDSFGNEKQISFQFNIKN